MSKSIIIRLKKFIDTLFNKNVPANVRNYICKDGDAPPAAEAPKPKKPKTEEAQPDQEVNSYE